MSSQYPVIYAGKRITAGMLSDMFPLDIIKTSHTDRSATTTLTADPDLTVELEASAVYFVEMFVFYATQSIAGFQTDWSVPSGATGNRWTLGSGSTQTATDNVSGRWGVHNFTTATSYGDRNSSTNLMGMRESSVITTTNAGTLALRWAQDTSDASSTRVASGSYMRVKRLT